MVATTAPESCAQRDRKRHVQLKQQRLTWEPLWRRLMGYLLPRRGRLRSTDASNTTNRGDTPTMIVDATPTKCLRTLSSGLMSGKTNPASQWFKLGSSDPELKKRDNVVRYFAEVTRRISDLFNGSNLYDVLPEPYLDLGAIGTAAVIFLEDDTDVFRFYACQPGDYWLATNNRQEVCTFHREVGMTVRQIVDEFAPRDEFKHPLPMKEWTNISDSVKSMYERGDLDGTYVNVLWVVCPNDGYDGDKIDPKFKRFRSCWYEASQGADDAKCLRESGFDEFPILTARWATNGENVYGDSPALDVLPDIVALQVLERRMAQALEKEVNPPLLAPADLANGNINSIPGGVTYYARNAANPTAPQVVPLYQVNFNHQAAQAAIEQKRQSVRGAMFTDLFLMLSADARAQPPTAEEIRAREMEKLLALGPVLERIDHEFLDRLLKRAFAITHRRGLLPPTPQELIGKPITIEYVSVMSQAQKLSGLGTQERFIGHVGMLAQFQPNVIDVVDWDQAARNFADTSGVDPDLLATDSELAAARQARAQQQQQAQQQQAALAAAKTARDLAASPLEGSNALTALTGGGA